MPLTDRQKQQINGYTSFALSNLDNLPNDKPKALTAMNLMIKDSALTLHEELTLYSWRSPEQTENTLFAKVHCIHDLLHRPNLNEYLDRFIGNDAKDEEKNSPATLDELRTYIKDQVTKKIQALKNKGIQPAKQPLVEAEYAGLALGAVISASAAATAAFNTTRDPQYESTPQYKLNDVLFGSIYDKDVKTFDQVLKLITQQDILVKNFKYSIEKMAMRGSPPERKLMAEKLLKKLLEQDINPSIFKNLLLTVNGDGLVGYGYEVINQPEMFKAILERMIAQEKLGTTINSVMTEKDRNKFYQMLEKVTDQDLLGKVLDIIEPTDQVKRQKMISSRIATQTLDKKEIIAPTSSIEPLGSIAAAHITNAPKTTLLNTSTHAIAAPSSINSLNNTHQSTIPISQGPSEQFNQNLYMGAAALAIALNTLGMDTSWMKPILGGKKEEVKIDFDPRTSHTYIDPNFNYTAKIEEMAKQKPDFERVAFNRIVEKALTSGEAVLSKEEWKGFAKETLVDAMTRTETSKSSLSSSNENNVGKKRTTPSPYH